MCKVWPELVVLSVQQQQELLTLERKPASDLGEERGSELLSWFIVLQVEDNSGSKSIVKLNTIKP